MEGSRKLSAEEVAFAIGKPIPTVYKWCQKADLRLSWGKPQSHRIDSEKLYEEDIYDILEIGLGVRAAELFHTLLKSGCIEKYLYE